MPADRYSAYPNLLLVYLYWTPVVKLIQNLFSIQQMLADGIESTKSAKHLSLCEKEADYFLRRYNQMYCLKIS